MNEGKKWASQKRYYIKNREAINRKRRAKSLKNRAYTAIKNWDGGRVWGIGLWRDESKKKHDEYFTKYRYHVSLADNKQSPLADAVIIKLALRSISWHYDHTYRIKSGKALGHHHIKDNQIWPYKDIHRFLSVKGLVPEGYKQFDVVRTLEAIGLYKGTAKFYNDGDHTPQRNVMKPVQEGPVEEDKEIEESLNVFPFFKSEYCARFGQRGVEYMEGHAMEHLNIIREVLGMECITGEIMAKAEGLLPDESKGRAGFFLQDDVAKTEGRLTEKEKADMVQEVIDSI